MRAVSPCFAENQASLIAQTLRREILRGQLPLGSPLAEPTLARRFGVSRAPVREAFFELASEGFLEFQTNGRTRVVVLSESDFQEILDVRVALESMAARRAAPSWTGDDSETVNALIERQAQSRTLLELGELDVELHAFLISRAGNARLMDLWQRIRAQFSVWLAHTHRVLEELEAGPREESVANHRQLLQAFETRDPETAARAAQAHVEIWRQKRSVILPDAASAGPGESRATGPAATPWVGLLVLLLGLAGWGSPLRAEAVPGGVAMASAEGFNQHILPLLQKHCFECHSHAHKIKGGLSLDYRSGWQKGGDSGPAILPGNVEESLLLRAVNHADPDLAMPPKKKLSTEEIMRLTEWVRAGAVDPRGDAPKKATDLEEGRKHWAFQPVSDPPVPSGAFASLSEEPIDRFIFDGLRREGLQPGELADRATLLRRVTLDLTGLPPSRGEMHAFCADERSDQEALAGVIDRLMESPAYGEKWARLWLDVARFADTTGCSSDWPIEDAWRYRDWVVRAFQKDLPFPRFIAMQIAGDLEALDLARSRKFDGSGQFQEGYRDGVTATGFLACSKRFGSNPNAFEHLTIADTLDNTWRALQGLSLGCARCHDHKFEPIYAKDYYALYGIFASSQYPYAGSELNHDAAVLVPLDPMGPSAGGRALEQWSREMVGAHGGAGSPRTVLPADATAWGFEEMERSEAIETRMPGSPWVVRGEARVVDRVNSPFVHLLPPGSHAVDFPATVAETEMVRRVRWPADRSGSRRIAVDLQVSDLWKTAAPRWTLGWRPEGDSAREMTLASLAGEGFGSLWLAGGSGSVGMPEKQWVHLAMEWEGASNRVRWELWSERGECLARVEASVSGAAGLAQEGDVVLRFEARQINGKPEPCVRVDNVVARAGVGDPSAPTVAALREPSSGASEGRDAERQKAQLASRVRELANSKPETAFAMWEGTPRDVAVQRRGEPEHPGPVVTRRNLTLFGGTPIRSPQLESGRRDLAQWLASDNNPLTQRVYLNRLWQAHFGRGIVASANDFGHTGAGPSHPELLDHLVQRFRESGYSTKAMHRLILLSYTYRQTAVPSLAAQERDPDNRWLSHFTARRLTAEELRDSVLSVSGLLDASGPGHQHAFPPREARQWSQHHPFSIDYEKGPAAYDHRKRSLYLLTTRLVPDAFLSTFDGADSNQSVSVRQQTTVALQSLALMNAPFVIEAADRMAREIPAEMEATVALTEIHARIFGEAPQAAKLSLLKTRFDSLQPPSGSSRKQALAVVSQALLTSNAFLYIR